MAAEMKKLKKLCTFVVVKDTENESDGNGGERADKENSRYGKTIPGEKAIRDYEQNRSKTGIVYEDLVFTDTQDKLVNPIKPIKRRIKNIDEQTREQSIEGLRELVQRLHARQYSSKSSN